MRILAAIACYGTRNDRFLHRLIDEYQSMEHEVDIVVLSNIPRELGPRVEVIVGLPTSNPWSLPFGHKKLFADRIDKYDLFIYSEDDTLITERTISAHVRVSAALPEDEIPGLLRFEENPGGETNYCDVHGCFHWEPGSVRRRGEYVLAFYTNEHAACYILTRRQLRRAIDSGGFLVEPYEAKYDLLCTAATDPYTRCGFVKLICISHLDAFLVHHLPNKYIGTMGIEETEFRRQIIALLEIESGQRSTFKLLETETRLPNSKWSKDYYESCRPEISRLISDKGIKSVLSVGCGSGAAEAYLKEQGIRVVGVPVDSVISSCAEARGIEIVQGDAQTVREKLAGRRFDCLLMSNILHLVEDPSRFLSSFADLAVPGAVVIAVVPNLTRVPVIWGRLKSDQRFKDVGSYKKTGVHVTSPWVVRRWLSQAGMSVEQTIDILSPQMHKASRLTLGLTNAVLASELIVVARKTSVPAIEHEAQYAMR